MNRSLLLGCMALGAIAILGLAYTRLTSAAPAPGLMLHSVSSAAPAVVEPSSVQRATRAAADASGLATSADSARLEERRVLYETVDALLQAAEFARARQLLDEYQARSEPDAAGEWRDIEQGYRLMADCLEHPGAEQRARSETFLRLSNAQAISDKLRVACK